MKRNAAIVGPTPAFVRWSIRQKCSLRQETDLSDPEQTARCLGSVREVNCAIAEGRVVDGFGLKMRDTDALAFSIDEVLSPFGGIGYVRDICATCPGNVEIKNQFNPSGDHQIRLGDASFAGCFGQITIDDFQEAVRQLPKPLAAMLPKGCLPSEPFWFGLWCKKIWEQNDLNVLSKVLEHQILNQQDFLKESTSEKISSRQSSELLRFEEAVKKCASCSLKLDIESYPAGCSDGLNWQIETHCGRCKAFQKEGTSSCDTCGRQGGPQATRKRKVLGLRPYVSISDLVDSRVAAQLCQWFVQNNS